MVEILPGQEPATLYSVESDTEAMAIQNCVVIDDSDSDSDTVIGDSDDDVHILGVSRRQLPQQSPRTEIPEFSSEGRLYKPGKSVELYDGTFLRILQVLRGDGDEIFLRGWRLERQEEMHGLVPKNVNELCWISNITSQESLISNMDEVALSVVQRLRIVKFTNRPYPQRPRDTQEDSFTSDTERRREGVLFCRSRYVRIWEPGKNRKPVEEAIIFLTYPEADMGFRIDPEVLRRQWRGETVLGGSYCDAQASENVISVRPDIVDLSGAVAVNTNDHGQRDVVRPFQKYTFGDSFCGAGGVSRGALQAGLRVVWGFDKCHKAMNSYRQNFHTAIGETCEVADFLTNKPSDIRVDVMHLSPPCNTFSSAKTISASTDEANESCIFSARPLVEAARPRIATMEETAGLQERHEPFLFATIHTFIDLGYSVRWRLLSCLEYGVPQRRKRLIIIASGPGESLPCFPKPAHGPPGSGLLPYRTIHDAIADIPPNAPDHDPEYAASRAVLRRPSDPRSFAKTITCSGGDNYHPSGERPFTYREFACLQTFPLEHRFCGVAVKKQIGNAVPPMLAKSLFREIIKELERTDGVRGANSRG